MQFPMAMLSNWTVDDNISDNFLTDNLCLGDNTSDCNDMTLMASLLLKFQKKRPKGPFEIFVDNLTLYFIPVIIVLGLCGNTLSILVFTCTHLRRLSSSLYLCCLSLADVGFLVALSIGWLDRIGVHWLTMSGWCQIVVYLTRVTGCLSVWFVLSFTAERYVIVYHALRKDMLCTRRRAKIVIATLCCVTLLMYTYIFKTYDVIALGTKKTCGPVPQYQDVMTIITSLDTAVACVIPSCTILLLNIKIIYKLHQFQNQRLNKSKRGSDIHHQRAKSVVGQASISLSGSMRIKFSSHVALPTEIAAPPPSPPPPPPHLHIVTTTEKCQRLIRYQSHLRTARMLLILSSVFVLLNLPSHVFRIHAFVKHLLWDAIRTPRIQYKVHEFFEIFFFLNFAINFFVYSLCGKQFRTGLRRLALRVLYRCHKYREQLRKRLPRYAAPAKLPAAITELQEPLKTKYVM